MSRPVVVLKFGGTSLATPARVRLAARRVRAHLRHGRAPVVVVSARGHATDRIVAAVRGVGTPAGEAAPPHTREVDRALATGEDLAAALLAVALAGYGVSARSLRGAEAGLVADGDFGRGRIRQLDTRALRELTARGVVPVVSGFQAGRADGETLTLGRGGSDTSAVALAAALGRVPCHLVTDVAAVHDRDPRRHPDAIRLAELSHEALLGLARAGAQVLHADAAALAAREDVPLLIYHYRAPLSGRGGTRVRRVTAPELIVEAAA